MKNYLYIDTELLSSYLAQENVFGISQEYTLSELQGNLDKIGQEKNDGNTSVSTQAGIPLLGGSVSYSDPTTISKEEMSNINGGINSTVYKSHAINLFKKYGDLDNKTSIEIEDIFEFYDLVSLIDISNFTLIENYDYFLRENAINQLKIDLDKENITKKILDNHIKKQKEKMKNAKTGMEFLSKILPTKTFLESKNYIIPLNENYLLFSKSMINVLSNSETKIVGIKGQYLIKESTYDKNSKNLLRNLKNSLDNVSGSTLENLGIGVNKKILIPIAWYQD